MLETIKENFGGSLRLALKRDLDSDLISLTTRAKFEWALEEIARLESLIDDAYDRGYEAGFDEGFESW